MIVLMDGRARYSPDKALIIDAGADMTLEEAINEAINRGDDSIVVETDDWQVLWIPEQTGFFCPKCGTVYPKEIGTGCLGCNS